MTILNETYYQNLWNKYESTPTLQNFNSKTSCLSTKLILDFHKKGKSIHINFQNSIEPLLEIGKNLFIEFSNDIFMNHWDLPDLKVGDKLRDRRKHSDGKKHYFKIIRITNNHYQIEDIKNKAQSYLEYDDLVKKFIPTEQRTRQLKGYFKFFSDLNGEVKLDFTPTNFEQKIVFISKKTFWDCLPNKNKIPCTYLPNPREEKKTSEIKSIPALQDCIAYFTPKYEVCYQSVLSKDESVKTIIVFDTETDKIEQIIQDQNRFKFNLIIISNDYSSARNQSIPCWNWFKEEVEIVNSL